MRADNPFQSKHVYEFGNFRLNTAQRVIESAGQSLSLAPKALDVLIVLIENRGRIVEKEDLMRTVWPDTFVEDNNLAFNISVLRKLFGESGATPRYIETVPKRGYRFIAEVVEIPENELPGKQTANGDLDGRPITLSVPTNVSAPVTIFSGLARPRNLVAVLFALAVVGILISLAHRAPKLTDKDTIVLADFTNKTGDPVFDGTLVQGLAAST
jgi:DNA-binding winged helix-turn-helix (wHTH) protein